jgi:hypothetical protein
MTACSAAAVLRGLLASTLQLQHAAAVDEAFAAALAVPLVLLGIDCAVVELGTLLHARLGGVVGGSYMLMQTDRAWVARELINCNMCTV